jgi:hypothetical protein
MIRRFTITFLLQSVAVFSAFWIVDRLLPPLTTPGHNVFAYKVPRRPVVDQKESQGSLEIRGKLLLVVDTADPSKVSIDPLQGRLPRSLAAVDASEIGTIGWVTRVHYESGWHEVHSGDRENISEVSVTLFDARSSRPRGTARGRTSSWYGGSGEGGAITELLAAHHLDLDGRVQQTNVGPVEWARLNLFSLSCLCIGAMRIGAAIRRWFGPRSPSADWWDTGQSA